MSPPAAVFGTDWVHAFEEDGPEGAVYRPEGFDLPRSRRPRSRLCLSPDGNARVTLAGPDDRLHEIEARWCEEEGEIVLTAEQPSAPAGSPPRRYRARVTATDRLVVRRG